MRPERWQTNLHLNDGGGCSFRLYIAGEAVNSAQALANLQALARGQPGLGMLLGGGAALWVFRVLGTWLGTQVGDLIADARRWGLDMVMGCFMLAMAVGGEKNGRTFAIWGVAACASLVAYRHLPENSHVVVGALAGGLLGAAWKEAPHGD